MTTTLFWRGVLWRGLLAGIAVMVCAAPGFAQATTYSYQGNNYNFFNPPAGMTFTPAMSVSGSFQMTLPLPANLVKTGIGPPQLADYSFSNGVFTFTPANSQICLFEIATNPFREIVQWDIQLRESGVPVGSNQQTVATMRVVGAEDQGDIFVAQMDPCANGPSADTGSVQDQPGVWTSDAMTPAPTLPVWGMLLLLTLLALAGISTLRARQRP